VLEQSSQRSDAVVVDSSVEWCRAAWDCVGRVAANT
jgi:hypothetical protein